MRRIARVGIALLFLVAIVAVQTPQAGGPSGPGRTPDASALAIGGGGNSTSGKPLSLTGKGEIEVVVGLVDASLSAANGRDFKQKGGALNKGQQKAYLNSLTQKQNALMTKIRNLGGRELGRVNKALNAVAVAIDASRIRDIEVLPGVKSVRPLRDYTIELSVQVDGRTARRFVALRVER